MEVTNFPHKLDCTNSRDLKIYDEFVKAVRARDSSHYEIIEDYHVYILNNSILIQCDCCNKEVYY